MYRRDVVLSKQKVSCVQAQRIEEKIQTHASTSEWNQDTKHRPISSTLQFICKRMLLSCFFMQCSSDYNNEVDRDIRRFFCIGRYRCVV